jgi:hypothetical protein
MTAAKNSSAGPTVQALHWPPRRWWQLITVIGESPMASAKTFICSPVSRWGVKSLRLSLRPRQTERNRGQSLIDQLFRVKGKTEEIVA